MLNLYSIPKLFSHPETDFADCTCPVPCKRVRYEPNLSYAQLSRINVERLVLGDEQSRKRLQVGYSTYLKKRFILRDEQSRKRLQVGYSTYLKKRFILRDEQSRKRLQRGSAVLVVGLLCFEI